MCSRLSYIGSILDSWNSGLKIEAIDKVYDIIDDLLLGSKFDEVREILLEIMVSNFPLTLLLSVLTVTYPWREILKEERKGIKEVVKKEAERVGKVGEIKHYL